MRGEQCCFKSNQCVTCVGSRSVICVTNVPGKEIRVLKQPAKRLQKFLFFWSLNLYLLNSDCYLV